MNKRTENYFLNFFIYTALTDVELSLILILYD